MTHNKMDKLMKIYSENFINILLKQLGYNELIKLTCPNELIIKSNKYEADFVGYTNKNEILNIEFQSTKITEKDKSRFTKYAILLKDKYNKNIKTIIISTANKAKRKVTYRINEKSQHIINLEVLTTINGDKLYNNIQNKHKNNEKLREEDIANLSLIPLMKTKEPIDKVILKICKLTNDLKIKQEDLDYLKQSQKMLTERYVKEEEIKKSIQKEIKMVTDLFEWKDKETEEKLRKEGKIEGKIEEKYNIAVEMLKENMKIEKIMKFTKLTEKEILNLEKMNAK